MAATVFRQKWNFVDRIYAWKYSLSLPPRPILRWQWKISPELKLHLHCFLFSFLLLFSTLFEKQNWIVGHRWTFPFHRKKNNTLGLGDFKFLSFSVNGPFWSGKKFYILVPIPILYYSQCLILEEGNNTLYRWELMVWERWKEHTFCVYV